MQQTHITTSAKLLFNNGVKATIKCSMDANKPFQAELMIKGSTGDIHMENPLSPHKGHVITTNIGKISTSEKIDGRITYDHQLAHVLDVMRGLTKPYLGGKDAVANMAVIDNIYHAAGLPPR